MAFTSIAQDLNALFGTNQTVFNNDLEVDVTILEAPEFKATPTSKRVESGSISTDNVRIEPVTLDMDIWLTDDTFAPIFGSSAQDKADKLEGYWRLAKLNRVQTDFRLYTNMIITSYKLNRTKESANAASIRISMKEMFIVSTSLLANAAANTADTVAATADQGFKATTAADPANTSFIAGIIDSATSFFQGG